MQDIIPPVARELLRKELSQVRFIRRTNKAGNLIYDFTSHEAPNLMREVGRLRELSFREAGGSVGREVDTDRFDFLNKPYHQLIVWDPDNQEIIGGYRYLLGADAQIADDGQPDIVSAHLFHYSQEFVSKYLPDMIELGRAFVQPAYQTRAMGSRSLFALDNLWDGLGALCHISQAKYLFGKVTIFPSYHTHARDLILAFHQLFNQGDASLAAPYKPVIPSTQALEQIATICTAHNREDNYKILQQAVRALDVTIPPLANAYYNLCPTMRFLGTAINEEMANVFEYGIVVPVDEIIVEKYERYITAYERYIQAN